MGKIKDVTGIRFGKLIAIKIIGKDKNRRMLWECICDCGQKTVVNIGDLTSSHTKSCGCGKIPFTHKMSHKRIYRIWLGMKGRCNNSNLKSYKYYGGRGIKVCKRWEKFENFYKDMKNGYKDNLTLDRINNNGDYHKENCRWITMKEQAANRRKKKFNYLIEVYNKRKLLSKD